MAGHIRQIALVMVMAGTLAGCAAAYDPNGFWNSATFWQEGQASDAATAALGKGDYTRAEQMATEALRRNPKDPYALLVLAITYHNSGRPELARQYYEAILAMKPQALASVGTGSATPRPIVEIAQANLAQLMGVPRAAKPFAAPESTDPDTALITRFQTLRRLLDEGLMTQDEYAARRSANLGALLPYTQPPPSANLTRPAPGADQVVDRLQAMGQSLESKSISPREHGAERAVILDGIMPATAVKSGAQPAPPAGVLDAAAAVGRLERLREAKVITADELAKERDAIFKSLRAATAKAEPPAPPPVVKPKAKAKDEAKHKDESAAPPLPSGAEGSGRMTVHLASLGSEAQAHKEWETLLARFPELLHGLTPSYTKVDLGGDKGVFWRLKAGPLPTRQTADKLCASLKRQKQFCAPVAAE